MKFKFHELLLNWIRYRVEEQVVFPVIRVVKENQTEIYPSPNFYRINFSNLNLTNVVGMRLVSTEIPNVSYSIVKSGLRKNNCFYWVNEKEGTFISDKIAVSDQIYLNSVNKDYFGESLSDYPSRGNSQFKTNISNVVTSTINSSYTNINSYIQMTKNKMSKFYTPPNLFNEDYFLNNNYHLVGNTLFLNYVRTNLNETVFKEYLPWEYNYYLKYNNNGTDYGQDVNYIPDILGYQIFDIKTSTVNNLEISTNM